MNVLYCTLWISIDVCNMIWYWIVQQRKHIKIQRYIPVNRRPGWYLSSNSTNKKTENKNKISEVRASDLRWRNHLHNHTMIIHKQDMLSYETQLWRAIHKQDMLSYETQLRRAIHKQDMLSYEAQLWWPIDKQDILSYEAQLRRAIHKQDMLRYETQLWRAIHKQDMLKPWNTTVESHS